MHTCGRSNPQIQVPSLRPGLRPRPPTQPPGAPTKSMEVTPNGANPWGPCKQAQECSGWKMPASQTPQESLGGRGGGFQWQ